MKQSNVNWKGILMLATAGVTVAGGATAYVNGGGIGMVMAIGGVIAMLAMHRAGFNPPADYARQGLERKLEAAQTPTAREAAERELAAYDAEQDKARKA